MAAVSMSAMAVNDTPSASALVRSISRRTLAPGGKPSGYTPATLLLCAARASNWFCAACKASTPWLARSCRRSEKPDELPSSSMAGGIRLMITPSFACAMAACASATSSCAVAPLRCFQSFSMVNARPAFGPAPEKLKPRMDWFTSMPGRVATCCSYNLTTSSVRSMVASDGSWIEVMK